MDQSAFRAMLASGKSSSSLSSGAVLGGASSRKRTHDSGTSWAQAGSKASSSSSSSSNLFKPRTQSGSKSSSKPGIGSKGKEREDEDATPSYRRYGYTDRATMRRAGITDGDNADEASEERRPRGLDLSLLDASKRALLQGEDYVPEEAPLPPKTEEEVERELEAAEREMQGDASPNAAVEAKAELAGPPAKKQKRSRADMLRDLQAKIAAASGGAASPDPTQTAQSGPSQPVAMKGFKAVEKAPVKKKKAKKPQADSDAIANAHPEEMSSTATVDNRKVTDTSTSKAEMPAVDEADDDADIFAGAGDYQDDLDEDEDGEVQSADGRDVDSGTTGKYFEDQEDLIPKFQTYRSPTPPPREARKERERSEEQPSYNPYAEEASGEPAKPQRLEGLSSSAYTARDLLAYDDAQARDEKRRLKKLKGKEKKEAQAREAEYEGTRNAEQKEKDRLNREVQEYERYERKKGRA